MNQEEILFDNRTATESLELIKDIGLRKILKNFGERVEQISDGNTLAFNVMFRGLRHYKIFRYWLEESRKIPNYDAANPEHQRQRDKLMLERFAKESNENYEQALRYVQEFRKEDELFRNISYQNSLNSLVNIWTSFESSVKEVWIYCVNSYPKIFIHEILKHGDTTEITSGKNISFSLLAKYNFNISNLVGQILQWKFDFTSVNGIKKAFLALLNQNNISLQKFDDPFLIQLEIARHLVVHNVGIIDQEYLKRTIKQNEKIGELINFSAEEMRNYGNSCIVPIVELVKELDKRVNAPENDLNKGE